MCLDAATGKVKWHFQTVHHGLWDWDIPTQPNLVTITVDGKRIDAVAQVTKRGDTFVFDRVTGTPVWPIVERPVPTDSDVPGEKPYPTQPFPTKPRAFVDQGVTLEDANNLTPEIRTLAQEQMQKFRIGPMFTPPSLKGTLAAAEPGRRRQLGRCGIRSRDRLSHRAREQRDRRQRRRARTTVRTRWSTWTTHMSLPSGSSASLPGGLPLVSPPYAVLVAIDLNRGEIAWKVPLGGQRDGPQSSAAQGGRAARPARVVGQPAAARW